MDTSKITASQLNRPDQQTLLNRFFELQQQHLFSSWNTLLPEQQNKLLNDLGSISEEFLKKLSQIMTSPPRVIKSLEPCKYIHKAKSRGDRAREEEARRIGENAVKSGKVALFLAAGGQGTRLNSKGMTKGKCAVGPLTQHTLFQIYAEKILALQRRYEVSLPIWIMTSRENHAETEQFFFQNSLFGLLEKDIHFVQQEMIPSLDLSGKFFLADPCSVAKNPNGDGGALQVLKSSGAIDKLLETGYEYLFCFHVDNPLIQIADATFLGWHIKENADFSAKVFTHFDPEEQQEVVAMINGKAGVLEPEEVTEEIQRSQDEEGNLKYHLRNTSIYFASLSLLHQISFHQLPYHKYLRKISFWSEANQLVVPEKENGYKFETCLFDLLGEAKNPLFVEIERREEYAPIKTADGPNSLDFAQKLQTNLFASWLEQATMSVPRDKNGEVEGIIEISPLFAMSAQELKQKLAEKKTFTGELLLEEPSDET